MTPNRYLNSTTSYMARTIAVAAVVGVTFLAGPLMPARAGSAVSPVIQLAQTAPAKTQAGKEVTGDKSETVRTHETDGKKTRQSTKVERKAGADGSEVKTETTNKTDTK